MYAEKLQSEEDDRKFLRTNIEQCNYIAALRVESNAKLASYQVPPTPPTSRGDTIRLCLELQGINTELVEMAKQQVQESARFLQLLRRSDLYHKRLISVGVTRDTHQLLYVNNDQLIRAVAKIGCNRAYRVFQRQALYASNPKAEARAFGEAVKTEPKPPAKRASRAKKVPQPVPPPFAVL